MEITVEQARKVLVEDLASYPYTLEDPLGHAATYRKIKNYMYACVTNVVSKADCVDWLYSLYHDQSEEQCFKFQSKIDTSANMLYDFYEYLSKL